MKNIKVEILDSRFFDNYRALEEHMNDFIKGKSIVDIKTTSTYNSHEMYPITTYLIMYEVE